MNKKLSIIFLMAVILAISLTFNVINFARYNQSRQMLINHLYNSLHQSVLYLDNFLADNAENIQDANKQLEYAGAELIKLDAIINENASYYKNPLYYPGILSFSFVAGTLMYGNEHNVNGKQIYTVLHDTPISNNERTFVKTLRDDLNSLVNDMSDIKDKNNANESLSIEQVNNILKKFYDKWSCNITDSSPYRLLMD